MRYLTTIEEKIFLLERAKIDHLLILPFTVEFAALNSCEFVEKYLVHGMGVKWLLIGHNHKFGKNREGDFHSLQDCSRRFGFRMDQLPPYTLDGEKVSSTFIRGFLNDGKITNANKYLGYDYFLQGTVSNGDRLGRKLGFPTANIQPVDNHKLIPRDGVYAVHVEVEGSLHRGMLNIGFRPTLGHPEPVKTIEVNIFDFGEDLYEKQLSIHFRHRLRDEKKFDNLEQLKQQLVIDRMKAEQVLEGKGDE